MADLSDFGLGGAKFSKMGDSLPGTPINRRANFIIGREIRNRAKNNHANSKRYIQGVLGERDNARNNARCTQARKTARGLDGRHHYVDKTPREETNRMAGDSDILLVALRSLTASI